MPLYTHLDKISGKQVEILRPFDKYQESPTSEEARTSGLTEEEIEIAQWEKIIGTGIRITRGPNWQGSKGNW